MSVFASIDRVSLDIPIKKGKTQGVTLLIRDDLSVEQAIVYQKRVDEHEGDNFEIGIAMLLAYVEGWEVDGEDSATPWDEATLRKVNMAVFEALMTAVSDQIAPPETEESEDSRPNA